MGSEAEPGRSVSLLIEAQARVQAKEEAQVVMSKAAALIPFRNPEV